MLSAITIYIGFCFTISGSFDKKMTTVSLIAKKVIKVQTAASILRMI